MASEYVTNLKIRRLNVSRRLAALEQGGTYDKPDAVTSAGTTIQHQIAKQNLLAELKSIDELLKSAAETEAALSSGENGPWEIES